MNNNGGAKVSSLFSPDEVLCGLKSVSRTDCLRLLAKRLVKSGAVPDVESTLKALMAREALGSTVVAPGLAVPHARMAEVKGTVMAVGTSPRGVEFGPKGTERANLIVMIITHVDTPGAYLQVLAAVARTFSSEKLVQRVSQLSTPEQVWEFFDKGAGVLPAFITAADMMRTKFVTLRHTDTLATAIDCFCSHSLLEIPVLDDDSDLVGVVGEAEILKLSLPEYILWLDDLTPILQFEPFGEILKDEHITRVAEIMSKRFLTVEEDTPAIQVARELMREDVRKVLVVRGTKLVGIITLSHLLERVLRG